MKLAFSFVANSEFRNFNFEVKLYDLLVLRVLEFLKEELPLQWQCPEALEYPIAITLLSPEHFFKEIFLTQYLLKKS